jgi:hypothetical protein
MFFGLAMFINTVLVPLPVPAQPAKKTQNEQLEPPKIIRGQEAQRRLEELKRSNANVRAALSPFERQGLRPSTPLAIFARIPRNDFRFTPVKYTPQQTLSGDGVEIMLMGFLSLMDEWQGSTITTFYNADGTVDEQYVADIVITRDPYNRSDWQCRFEVKFEDGVGHLRSQPGMFTGFRLGIPIDQQPVPPAFNLMSFQFPDAASRAAYYAMFPEQVNYDQEQDPNNQPPGGRAIIRDIRYAVPQRDPDLPWRPQTGGNGATIVGWRAAARTAGSYCGWGAVGCALGSLISAEATFTACASIACTTGVVRGAVTNLRSRPK